MKIPIKQQKNICKNTLFFIFCGYIYNKGTKTVDLPAFINDFKNRVYVKESSHIDVNANTWR